MLSPEEVNYVLEYFTQKNQVESFDTYFAYKPSRKPETKQPQQQNKPAQAKQESKPAAAKPQPKPESKPEVRSEAKPASKPETKTESKPEVKQEAKPQTKPQSKPEANPQVKQEAKPENKPEVKPEAKSAANPLPRHDEKKPAKKQDRGERVQLVTNSLCPATTRRSPPRSRTGARGCSLSPTRPEAPPMSRRRTRRLSTQGEAM